MYSGCVDQPTPDPTPIEFLQLVADPLRWQLMQELARSDRRVNELTALADKPQNLVSYHLRELRTAGLVSARRSSADGRDTYYRVDLARCGRLLCATGAALHPGLRLGFLPHRHPTGRHADGRRGSCSCAPATAPAPRSPRRCSRSCRATRSRPAAPGAIRRCSIPMRCGSWPTVASTSRADRPSTCVDSRGCASTTSSPCATGSVRSARSSRSTRRSPTGASPTRPSRATRTTPPTRRSSGPPQELETRIGFLLPQLITPAQPEETSHA